VRQHIGVALITARKDEGYNMNSKTLSSVKERNIITYSLSHLDFLLAIWHTAADVY